MANYARELTDPLFWNSLFNTFSIFLLSSVPQVITAIAIAAVLDQNLRAKTFWRLSVLLPYVVTPVAVSLIFSNIFGEKYGLINNVLTAINLDPIMWKTETLPSHIALATMVNWRWTGYNALILLAAMQAVPRDIYESAAIDGASPVRRFFSITVPASGRRSSSSSSPPPSVASRSSPSRSCSTPRARCPAARNASTRRRCCTSGTWPSTGNSSAAPPRSPGSCSC
nr:sugar ABC transporter permease [Tessaracoccus coleopterorum]